MDKILSFVLVAFGLYKVVFSFVENLEFGTLFGAEINIWLYRAIWAAVVILGVMSIMRKMKQQPKG